MPLTDIYEKLASADVEIAAENEELYKQAAEEEAAGRITARGFFDELRKLAASGGEPPGLAPEPKADAASGPLGGPTMGKPALNTGGAASKASKNPGKLPPYTPKGPADVDTSKMMMGRSGSRE